MAPTKSSKRKILKPAQSISTADGDGDQSAVRALCTPGMKSALCEHDENAIPTMILTKAGVQSVHVDDDEDTEDQSLNRASCRPRIESALHENDENTAPDDDEDMEDPPLVRHRPRMKPTLRENGENVTSAVVFTKSSKRKILTSVQPIPSYDNERHDGSVLRPIFAQSQNGVNPT